jgi:CrcB protein
MWSRVLLVACFGAVGAVLRYFVGISALRYLPSSPYVGTLIVNLLGCFLFGLVSQLGQGAPWLTPHLRIALLTGFMGAFTTFSSFSFDTVQLLESRGWPSALLYVLVQNVVGIGLTLLGMSVGRSWA